jgi:hypothetical protein
MTKTSFIKIYGPPVLKSIRALEKIAIDMPEVCIMDTMIADSTPDFVDPIYTSEYFSSIPAEIEVERCDTIISKSGQELGEHDFFFEWFKVPTMDELNNLVEKIDEALAPIGSRYTITTK